MLDADATLRFPDFRAEERTFALVAQLAGRAGRGREGGRVLVQTLAPDAAAIGRRRAPRRGGLPGGELARRRALAVPPFADLIRVVVLGRDGEPGGPRRRRAAGIAAGGAAPRSSGRRRCSACAAASARQVVVKTTDAPARRRGAVGAAVERPPRPLARGVAFWVDVDPQ